jgi:hypothetical protein
LACPFFMPMEKLSGAWPHPGRLPLGGGWSGHCTAPGHEGEVPTHDVLQESCNLGYATACHSLPPNRPWDAVRFAVSGRSQTRIPDETDVSNPESTERSPCRIIPIRFVCERNHQPVEHGRLEYDAAASKWVECHSDERVQRMAECFLESLGKKKRPQSPEGVAIQAPAPGNHGPDGQKT